MAPPRIVLFVDDDESQRMLAKMVLGRVLDERATLRLARNAEEARATLEEVALQGGRVLVLSDHHMPGETGLELARAAKEAHGTMVRFVLLADSLRLSKTGPIEGPDVVIDKPLSLAEYRALLERLVREWNGSF